MWIIYLPVIIILAIHMAWLVDIFEENYRENHEQKNTV